MKRFYLIGLLVILVPVMLLGADGTVWTWFTDRWGTIVAMIGITLGAFAVPGLRTLMVLALKTLVSEAVLKKIFLLVAKKFVLSTKTKVDDIWLEELEKQLKKK